MVIQDFRIFLKYAFYCIKSCLNLLKAQLSTHNLLDYQHLELTLEVFLDKMMSSSKYVSQLIISCSHQLSYFFLLRYSLLMFEILIF